MEGEKKKGQDRDPQPGSGGAARGQQSHDIHYGEQQYYYQQHLPQAAYGYHMIDAQWAAHTHSMQQQGYEYYG